MINIIVVSSALQMYVLDIWVVRDYYLFHLDHVQRIHCGSGGEELWSEGHGSLSGWQMRGSWPTDAGHSIPVKCSELYLHPWY